MYGYFHLYCWIYNGINENRAIKNTHVYIYIYEYIFILIKNMYTLIIYIHTDISYI